MEMNLQMFAENTQTTAGLSAEMKTYYGMELLENAKPQLVHNQFAATKGLPAGGGKTVEWRKFGAFDKALKPLTEGVTPDGSGISVSYITKELAQYGDYTTVSDMLDLTAIDDVVLEITDRHGSNMGLTLDTVTRNEIQQGKQVIYAPKIGSDGTKTDVTSRMTLDKDCRMTSELVAKAATQLKKMNAPTFDGKHGERLIRRMTEKGISMQAIKVAPNRPVHFTGFFTLGADKPFIMVENLDTYDEIVKLLRGRKHAKLFGTKVFLQTWVKVKENWRDNPNFIRSQGYNDE